MEGYLYNVVLPPLIWLKKIVLKCFRLLFPRSRRLECSASGAPDRDVIDEDELRHHIGKIESGMSGLSSMYLLQIFFLSWIFFVRWLSTHNLFAKGFRNSSRCLLETVGNIAARGIGLSKAIDSHLLQLQPRRCIATEQYKLSLYALTLGLRRRRSPVFFHTRSLRNHFRLPRGQSFLQVLVKNNSKIVHPSWICLREAEVPGGVFITPYSSASIGKIETKVQWLPNQSNGTEMNDVWPNQKWKSNVAASKLLVSISQLVDEIGTKSQPLIECFLGRLSMVVMLIDQTGNWNSKIVASKL